ncbi:SEC-C metal-binding domain-containing protein [Rhizohabitans arisaemae]|uniref:SEC-C metal-binding domain-containing protein n=1 Tax=Rhizohabitans arisaemae TaxID=2720610 RepID=UPI0024B207A8|nr:SEC-C metal-binding domain-containing protein [Rhizohabitans arisaemae]
MGADLLATVDGSVFTHVLTETERATGVLAGDDDLALWARLADDGLPLREGGWVRCRRFSDLLDGGTALHGPSGWLAGFEADDLLEFRLRGGALEIELGSRPDVFDARVITVGQRFSEAAVEALHRYAEDPWTGSGALIVDVLTDLAVEYPGLFDEPLPPLTSMLLPGQFELSAGYVHLPGAPRSPAETAGLANGEIVKFALIRGALLTNIEPALPLRLLPESLTVLNRVADEVETAPLTEQTLKALLAAAADRDQQGLAVFLGARSALGGSRPLDALRLTEESLDLAPGLVPALLDAAEFAATRGETVRADALLQRAGLTPEQGLRPALQGLLPHTVSTTGRNQPCPCGSGQKYKKCCLSPRERALPRRAPLLHALLVAYASRPTRRERLGALIELAGGGTASACVDLALFEAGTAAEFLGERGEWLRLDEHSLIGRWCQTPLALYEVVHVIHGHSAQIRPVPDGTDPIPVNDGALAGWVSRGDVLLGRLLATGAEPRLFSTPLRIAPGRVPEALALLADSPDPKSLAKFFAPNA